MGRVVHRCHRARARVSNAMTLLLSLLTMLITLSLLLLAQIQVLPRNALQEPDLGGRGLLAHPLYAVGRLPGSDWRKR